MRDLSFREKFTYDSEFIKFKGGEDENVVKASAYHTNLILCI